MEASLTISIISAAISIFTFILAFPKLRKESKGRLRITSALTEDRKQIKVVVKVTSFGRVVYITDLEVYYGSMPSYKQLALQSPMKPFEMSEAKQEEFFIDITALKEGTVKNKVEQRYYSLLWVRVITSISDNPLKKVSLPENYFENTKDRTAQNYMATDDLVGFPLMKPMISALTVKAKAYTK